MPKIVISLLIAGLLLALYISWGIESVENNDSDAPLAAVELLDTYTKISTAEEAYFSTNGKYFQVIADNRNPLHEPKTPLQAFGKNVANGFTVDVYKTPTGGLGYQIRWSDAHGSYSRGYGPESVWRTWDYLLPIIVATSTP